MKDEVYKIYKDCLPSYRKCLRSYRLWHYLHQIVNDNYHGILIIPSYYSDKSVIDYLYDSYNGYLDISDEELRIACEGAFQFMVYDWQECIKFKYIQI